MITLILRLLQNGVAVFNTPNLMNHAVADLTLGLIISLIRRICDGNEYVKRESGKEIGTYSGEKV